jgi:hypothetical protein
MMWYWFIALAVLGLIGMIPDIDDAITEIRAKWASWRWKREFRKGDAPSCAGKEGVE